LSVPQALERRVAQFAVAANYTGLSGAVIVDDEQVGALPYSAGIMAGWGAQMARASKPRLAPNFRAII